MQKKKILFFSHAVTMAHFARPLKWIEGIDRTRYDVYLASDPKFKSMMPQDGVTFIDASCIDSAKFSDIVGRGAPIYDLDTFEKHIVEDLKIMDLVKPDVVIGDFRHSLSVSSRLKGVKYLNVTNAYWSTDIKMQYPMPEAPIVRKLGMFASNIMLNLFLPLALKFNFFKMAFILRKPLRSVGLKITDYRQIITDGNLTLYCDTPDLIPLKKQKSNERFVGPVVWSMPVGVPAWWNLLNPNKKRIFLSLGSSGPSNSLPLIVRSLAKLDVEVIVALAGQKVDLPLYPNVFTTDYLPIDDACENSDLVICNGGSPVCHAALKHGVPTVGIVCNNDQLLNMAHIARRGAGLILRYWDLTDKKIVEAVQQILTNPKFLENSRLIEKEFNLINVPARLQSSINEILE